ncbi:hypothetical protein Pla175_01890 [Pirellulimonas nuda]|uniref:Uncharacterized protein n=2 Tax=Pirellulimonas nuda TaxID=2528009 RepID=A0A518D5T4_9BACT|nr:hypothetical protein Pla175_01890 [Pirellulimonas nuda]
MLRRLTDELRSSARWDELFEAQLLAARRRLGMPLTDDGGSAAGSAAAAPELTAAYREACLEAGRGWLALGQHRRAWPYLRACGAQQTMRDALRLATPDSESADALIEVALFEGACPALGAEWLIEHSGTCAAVTTLEQLVGQFDPPDAVACAAVLVRRLHHELVENLTGAVLRSGQAPPNHREVGRLLAEHPGLMEGGGSHVDASHLTSAVRLARLLEEPEDVRLAGELAQYGERLDADWLPNDPPPFEAFFPTHRLLLDATLGERVEEALAYFRSRAEEPVEPYSASSAAETLLVLLGRLGRDREALRFYAALAQQDRATPFSSYAPAPLMLAKRSGEWEAYDRLMGLRDDPVGLALGRLSR